MRFMQKDYPGPDSTAVEFNCTLFSLLPCGCLIIFIVEIGCDQ